MTAAVNKVTPPLLLWGCMLSELYECPIESTMGPNLCLEALAGLIKASM